jgi:hypothetical protein
MTTTRHLLLSTMLMGAVMSASSCAFVIVGGNITSDGGAERAVGSWTEQDDDPWESRSARTFFVVPAKLPNGQPSDAQRAALEAWLVERAGGFTNMGTVAGAWKADDGRVVSEDNVAYLVSIDDDAEDFAEELEDRIEQDFNQEEAYVEQW